MKRGIILRLFELLWLPSIKPSNIAIDIIIPTIEKDLTILPLCIEGLRKNVNHPIKNIYIVGPNILSIRDFCTKENLIFVDEYSVFNFNPQDLKVHITSSGKIINRSGWIFQQLIKLSGKIGTEDNYLCIDSDHILLNKHTFIDKDGIPIFYMSSENHKPYYKNIKRLLPSMGLSQLSYVAHKMIFNKKHVNELHKEIEKYSKNDWIKTIINSLDLNETSSFSEFEIYGNFIKKKHLRPWKQKQLSYKEIDTYKNLEKKYNKYNSITFPEWYSNNK